MREEVKFSNAALIFSIQNTTESLGSFGSCPKKNQWKTKKESIN